MTFKELIRNVIYFEMADISSLPEEAEKFGADPRVGEKLAAFFTSLAQEKRTRLKELGTIFREGTGMRQRPVELPRSVEATLRARIVRAETAARLYADLSSHMNKPEYKEAVSNMGVRERETMDALRGLQAALKKT